MKIRNKINRGSKEEELIFPKIEQLEEVTYIPEIVNKALEIDSQTKQLVNHVEMRINKIKTENQVEYPTYEYYRAHPSRFL